MNKYKSYIKNRSKKNLLFLIAVIGVFFLVFFFARSFNKKIEDDIKTLSEDVEKTDKKIASVKEEIESIQKDYENRNTDAFKEKIAREKLGMVKKDEYVYKDNDKR